MFGNFDYFWQFWPFLAILTIFHHLGPFSTILVPFWLFSTVFYFILIFYVKYTVQYIALQCSREVEWSVASCRCFWPLPCLLSVPKAAITMTMVNSTPLYSALRHSALQQLWWWSTGDSQHQQPISYVPNSHRHILSVLFYWTFSFRSLNLEQFWTSFQIAFSYHVLLMCPCLLCGESGNQASNCPMPTHAL